MREHLWFKLSIVVLIAALFAVSVGPMAARAAAQTYPTGTVNTGALHIRSGPGVSYNVVFSVYRGTLLNLLGRTSDTSWVHVSLTNGVQGWVNSRYVLTSYALVNLPVEYIVPNNATGTVNTGKLNVRSGPGTGYGVVGWLTAGAGVVLQARNANSTWLKIQAISGPAGWVSAIYITTSYPISSLPVENIGPGPGGATATINTYGLNMRSGPSISYTLVGWLARYQVVTMLARVTDSSWVKVVRSDNVQGWVNARYLSTSYPIASLPVEGVVPPNPTPPPPAYRTHVVQAGENLFRIALNYGVNMYALAQLNGIVDLTRIYVGQVLIIPS